MECGARPQLWGLDQLTWWKKLLSTLRFFKRILSPCRGGGFPFAAGVQDGGESESQCVCCHSFPDAASLKETCSAAPRVFATAPGDRAPMKGTQLGERGGVNAAAGAGGGEGRGGVRVGRVLSSESGRQLLQALF